MIRWMLLIFILLVLVNSATGIIQKIGLGRLPGDFNFRFLGRQFFVPFASAVLAGTRLAKRAMYFVLCLSRLVSTL